jgi:hypothetical protein
MSFKSKLLKKNAYSLQLDPELRKARSDYDFLEKIFYQAVRAGDTVKQDKLRPELKAAWEKYQSLEQGSGVPQPVTASGWHHAEITGLLPTTQERNFQLVDVFGSMVDIVRSPEKADETAKWTVRWKNHVVDPFKAREKGVKIIWVRDGNKAASGKIKCPECGSTDYGLMPTDFETAKCSKCGKNWEIGIVDGINNPSDM